MKLVRPNNSTEYGPAIGAGSFGIGIGMTIFGLTSQTHYIEYAIIFGMMLFFFVVQASTQVD